MLDIITYLWHTYYILPPALTKAHLIERIQSNNDLTMKQIPKKVICTYKLARHLDKEGVIPKYNLQYLRYYLKLNIDATAHTAIGDVLVMEDIFQRIYAKFKGQAIGEDAVVEMVKVSNSPVLVPRMPFGKHKGLKMAEVPKDYLEWLSGTDLDEDLEYTEALPWWASTGTGI